MSTKTRTTSVTKPAKAAKTTSTAKPRRVTKSKPYEPPHFENLKTSTMTVMVYPNIQMDLRLLFRKILITKVEIPYTKKQKNVDKKRLLAPDGTIVSLQLGNWMRGIDTRKKRKIWCTVCRPIEIDGNREKKIKTVTEVPITNRTLKNPKYPSDAHTFKMYCSRCDQTYKIKEIKKINHFLNQLNILVSIGSTRPLLSVMAFKTSFKIAGCKSLEDAQEAVLCLWQN